MDRLPAGRDRAGSTGADRHGPVGWSDRGLAALSLRGAATERPPARVRAERLLGLPDLPFRERLPIDALLSLRFALGRNGPRGHRGAARWHAPLDAGRPGTRSGWATYGASTASAATTVGQHRKRVRGLG